VAEATCTLSVRKVDPAISIIDVSGEVTAFAEDALMQAYAQAVAPTGRAVMLNSAGLTYMNSGGIGLLVTLLVLFSVLMSR
jgi:anti-sigma B factor antagonist